MASEEPISLRNLRNMDWLAAEKVVLDYGRARQAFRKEQECQKKLLHGNDNKVGIAGEYWAMRYYHERLKRELKDRPSSSSHPGYDFRCAKGNRNVRVSVKSVSKENKKGRTVRLGAPEQWDELLLVILDYDLRPLRFGRATKPQYERAVANCRIGKNPYVSESWVNPKGWMSRGQYGTVEDSPF